MKTLSRRNVLEGGVLWLGAAAKGASAQEAPAVQFGVVTDVHHADKPPLGTRYYRESLGKLGEGMERFREARLDFVVNLGDLVDAAADAETERMWLKQAVSTLAVTKRDTHYVLGNHCVQTLRKAQFLSEVGRQQSFYSFDRNGVHFVILDACYRKDGISYDAGNFDWKDTEIPPEQRAWLRDDLDKARGPVIVFVHQRLDSDDVHAVGSAPEMRRILEESKKVAAVFQGHSHQNDHRQIRGIHYCTMRAVIEGTGRESSGYAVITAFPGGAVAVQGFRAQQSYPAMRTEG